MAALLHDVVDDTRIDFAEVEAAFGPQTAALVATVTRLSQMNQLMRRKARKAREQVSSLSASCLTLWQATPWRGAAVVELRRQLRPCARPSQPHVDVWVSSSGSSCNTSDASMLPMLASWAVLCACATPYSLLSMHARRRVVPTRWMRSPAARRRGSCAT